MRDGSTFSSYDPHATPCVIRYSPSAALLIALAAVVTSPDAVSQVQHGGTPVSFTDGTVPPLAAAEIAVPAVDRAALATRLAQRVADRRRSTIELRHS